MRPRIVVALALIAATACGPGTSQQERATKPQAPSAPGHPATLPLAAPPAPALPRPEPVWVERHREEESLLLPETYPPDIRFAAAPVPDAARRAKFETLTSAFLGANAGLCDGCEPLYGETGELPSDFQRRRDELARSLTPEELRSYVDLLLVVRATRPFDGHGSSEFEDILFEPILQPTAMDALTADLITRAQRRDVFGIGEHVLAEVALEAPAEAAPLFREIVAWPCELDVGEAPGKGMVVATWTEKTLAAAALTRVGTPDDVASAIATIERCAFAEGTAGAEEVRLTIEQLRAAPSGPMAWRQWFQDSFRDWLDSD